MSVVDLPSGFVVEWKVVGLGVGRGVFLGSSLEDEVLVGLGSAEETDVEVGLP